MRAPFSELILEADVFLYGTAAALVFNRREHPGERIEGREDQATRSVRLGVRSVFSASLA